MLRVDLRALSRGPVETRGTVAANDQLFEGVDFALAAGVDVDGRLSDAGPGRYYWRGALTTTVSAACRRCLRDVTLPVAVRVDALFTEDPLAEDPSVYPIPARAVEVDLRDAVREELILAVPEFVVCREDCRGICPRCGADLNTGPCGCRPASDPRWAALEALRPARPADER